MGAHLSSPDKKHSATSDLPSRRPWTPRLESRISSYEVEVSPFIVEIKNKIQWKTRLNALKDTNKLLVIEFTAKWCEPFKFLEPKVEELAAEYTKVEFVKIDVDVLTSAWMGVQASYFAYDSIYEERPRIRQSFGCEVG